MNELNIKSINGTSSNLNNQPGRSSACKPDSSAGKSNPGGMKPPRVPEKRVPLPTK